MAYYGKLEWLAEIRVSKGLPQDRVAAEAGISQALYSRIERGFRPPTKSQAQAIAQVLDFDASRFDEEEKARRAAV